MGMLVGVLPAVLYLTATDAWWDFLQRSIIIPASLQLPGAASHPMRWLEVTRDHYPNELIFFIAAGVGFMWYLARSARWGAAGTVRAGLHPRLGGLPALTLVLAGFNTIEFQGVSDTLLFLPVVAFWTAWLAFRLAVLIVSHRRPSRSPSSAAGFLLLSATAAYAFTDAFLYFPAATLQEEQALIREMVEPAGPDGTVVAIGAEEVYVLSGRRSPHPFLRLDWKFAQFIPLIEPEGCQGLVQRIIEPEPAVVVIYALWWWQGRCVKQIADALLRSGYQHESKTIRFRYPEHRSFIPDRSRERGRRWSIYRRAK